MSQSPAVLDEDRRRRLTSELVAVIRREVPWYDGDTQDPGVMLVDLFAFVGDLLSQYEERLADDAYVGTSGRARIFITVGGLPWRAVASLQGAGPDDAVYVVSRQDDGSATVRFGDRRHGRRPPTGARVSAAYRQDAGNGHAAAAVLWPPEPPLALEAHAVGHRMRFAPVRRSWLDCLVSLFSSGSRRDRD